MRKRSGPNVRVLDKPLLATCLYLGKKHTGTYNRTVAFKDLHDVAPAPVCSAISSPTLAGPTLYPAPSILFVLAPSISFAHNIYLDFSPSSEVQLQPCPPHNPNPALSTTPTRSQTSGKPEAYIPSPTPLSTFCLLHKICFFIEDCPICSLFQTCWPLSP